MFLCGREHLPSFDVNLKLAEPLLFLEDIVKATSTSHPDAVVQFDLKERLKDLDEETIASFEHLVAPGASRFLLSGDDWDAVRLIGQRVAGLKLGFDPSDLPQAAGLRSAGDFAGFAQFILEAAPEASIVYLEYHLVLASLGSGYDMIAGLHAGGKKADAWTFDIASPDSLADLARLIASNVDQISSNDAVALHDAAEMLSRPFPMR